MAAKIEQLEKGWLNHLRNQSRRGAVAKRYAKTVTHRAERRASKQLLEDAPKRREFCGWEY